MTRNDNNENWKKLIVGNPLCVPDSRHRALVTSITLPSAGSNGEGEINTRGVDNNDRFMIIERTYGFQVRDGTPDFSRLTAKYPIFTFDHKGPDYTSKFFSLVSAKLV